MALSISSLILCAISVTAIPLQAHTAQIKRQNSELQSHYDYIIAGGGTSGLTVANRLTAAFPNR